VLVMQTFLVISALIGLIPAIILGQRDRTLADLRASEERFRTLANASFEGVCLCEDGRIADANEPMLQMFGCRREDLLGRDVLELVGPAHRDEATECLRSGRELRHEYLLQRPDGSQFHAETQARTNRAGDRMIHLIAIRDVTAQRQLTAALEQQRLRLAGIINSSSDGILTVDGEQRILMFNPAAEQMFGCPEHDALGWPLERFIPGLAPAQLEGSGSGATGADGAGTLQGGARPAGRRRGISPGTVVRPDPARRPAPGHRDLPRPDRPDPDGSDAPAAGIASCARPRRWMRSGRWPAASRTILTTSWPPSSPTRSWRELAADNAALQEHLRLLVKSSDRAANLVRQLLTFTPAAAGSPAAAAGPGRRRGAGPAPPQFPGRPSRCTRAFAPECPRCRPTPRGSTRSSRTSAVNAVEAMPEKGGRIHVTPEISCSSTAPPARPHAALRANSYVRLTIRDDGRGMDAATLKRIFEPFFTTKEPGKGTGLSLAVVHGIIKQHGGAITAESEPGQGTTFTIYLPPAPAVRA
jgi:PAS domain S-box-containing protein